MPYREPSFKTYCQGNPDKLQHFTVVSPKTSLDHGGRVRRAFGSLAFRVLVEGLGFLGCCHRSDSKPWSVLVLIQKLIFRSSVCSDGSDAGCITPLFCHSGSVLLLSCIFDWLVDFVALLVLLLLLPIVVIIVTTSSPAASTLPASSSLPVPSVWPPPLPAPPAPS